MLSLGFYWYSYVMPFAHHNPNDMNSTQEMQMMDYGPKISAELFYFAEENVLIWVFT